MINLKNLQNFILQIAEEKGLDEEMVKDALSSALAIAYKKDYAHRDDKIVATMNDKAGKVAFFLEKTVFDSDAEVSDEAVRFDEHKHMMLSDARDMKKDAEAGDEIRIPVEYKDIFSRIAAQTAKQVIQQKLREIEKTTLFDQFKDKQGEIISGTVERIDQKAIYINLGKTTGVMFKNEVIPGEVYRAQSRMRFYVYAVENTARGVEIFLSRSHPLFLPAIFKVEVPEISENIVEIKGVARIPGVRTKLAVSSSVQGIDPVGACIGPKGSRIISIMRELNNEKIDIIPYSEDEKELIANALLPAKVEEVLMLEKHTVKVIVDEDQLPIALGKGGQNIKLAARLTGWKIDVRLEHDPEETVEGGVAETELEDDIDLESDDDTLEN